MALLERGRGSAPWLTRTGITLLGAAPGGVGPVLSLSDEGPENQLSAARYNCPKFTVEVVLPDGALPPARRQARWTGDAGPAPMRIPHGERMR